MCSPRNDPFCALENKALNGLIFPEHYLRRYFGAGIAGWLWVFKLHVRDSFRRSAYAPPCL